MSAIDTTIEKYVAINLESLRINSVLGFDLFLKKGQEFVLYRSAELPFTEKNRLGLLDIRVDQLYISHSNIPEYQKYIESNLRSIIDDPSLPKIAKAKLVYGSARLLVKDILANPTLKKNIERGGRLVESTVSYILNDSESFYNILDMMSFDYHTYTHSVNVCTFSVALAQFLGITNRLELQMIGTGALMHDIGKTRIPEEILKKNGKLTDEEFDLMKKHPEWGVEILRKTDIIPEESYFPVIEHHERENGTGYPNALHKFQIHDYSKIVSIADVFDAMTTRRVYRPAIKTYSALKTMFAMKESFDSKYLEKFTKLLGPQRK